MSAEPQYTPETPEEPPHPMRNAQERTWAALAHLSALTGLVTFVGFVVGPLLVWLFKKDEFPLVDDQGKESLNFQISMMIYSAVAAVLTFTVILALITIPLLIVIGVFDVVMVVIASLKANEGVRYRYPLTMRFVK